MHQIYTGLATAIGGSQDSNNRAFVFRHRIQVGTKTGFLCDKGQDHLFEFHY